MPPRISSSRLPQPHTCQCFRTRPRRAPEARQFHVSTRDETRLRKDMWTWLKGSGKAFRDPLAGSTNYLSAYDRQGNLLRMRRQQEQQAQQREHDDGGKENVSEEEMQKRELDEGLEEVERERRAKKRASQRFEDQEREERGGMPRERQSDLRPYPLNQDFRSQPVLSEPMREEIYRQLVVSRKDIESVAAGFGVDLRRVAAVARLKTIEKQWESEVSLASPFAHQSPVLCSYDDSNFKIRLVLKTTTWLQTMLCEPL